MLVDVILDARKLLYIIILIFSPLILILSRKIQELEQPQSLTFLIILVYIIFPINPLLISVVIGMPLKSF